MKVNQLSTNGFAVSEVFPAELLAEIRNTCDTFQPTKVQPSGESKREALFMFDGVLREKIVDSVAAYIKGITPNAVIRGVELWRDYPAFISPYHYDDVNVQNILIVYLGNEELDIGTGYSDDEQYSVPYKNNTGIILLNSDKVFHGMVAPVPDNVIRKSLYINWIND